MLVGSYNGTVVEFVTHIKSQALPLPVQQLRIDSI